MEKNSEISEIEESPKSPDDDSFDIQQNCIEIQSELQPSVYELVLKELQEASQGKLIIHSEYSFAFVRDISRVLF